MSEGQSKLNLTNRTKSGGRTNSDQAKSFRAFWAFLMSQQRQEVLSQLLEYVLKLPAVMGMQPESRLRRVHYDWLEAGENTQRAGALDRFTEVWHLFLNSRNPVRPGRQGNRKGSGGQAEAPQDCFNGLLRVDCREQAPAPLVLRYAALSIATTMPAPLASLDSPTPVVDWIIPTGSCVFRPLPIARIVRLEPGSSTCRSKDRLRRSAQQSF
jgi:hypothetical protein